MAREVFPNCLRETAEADADVRRHRAVSAVLLALADIVEKYIERKERRYDLNGSGISSNRATPTAANTTTLLPDRSLRR